MADVQAASSPAADVDVFNGQQPSLEEFSQWRNTGELPERFKPAVEAESSPAEAQETQSEAVEAESASESESEEEVQEHPQKGSGAEKRIKQLLARQKELERKLAEATKTDAKPESSTAPANQQHPSNARPKVEDTNPDGSPRFKDWDEYNEALIDWKAEQKLADFQRKQAERAHQEQVAAKVQADRDRFGDEFDTVIEPTASAIVSDPTIPLEVKRMLAQSDVMADLVHAIGSDPEGLEKLVKAAKADPLAAIRHVALIEAGIKAKAPAAETRQQPRDASGKFAANQAPEKKVTQAPKPPSPVSGGASRAFDVSDESLSPEEWMRKRNEQLGRK